MNFQGKKKMCLVLATIRGRYPVGQPGFSLVPHLTHFFNFFITTRGLMAPWYANDASAIQAGEAGRRRCPQAAIPLGILLQILLVIILGIVEGASGRMRVVMVRPSPLAVMACWWQPRLCWAIASGCRPRRR